VLFFALAGVAFVPLKPSIPRKISGIGRIYEYDYGRQFTGHGAVYLRTTPAVEIGRGLSTQDRSRRGAYLKIKLVNVTADPVSGVNAWLYLR
jgi:hypothetical protein